MAARRQWDAQRFVDEQAENEGHELTDDETGGRAIGTAV